MTAPGGHPRFVLSAATRRVVGCGEGSVNASPTWRRGSEASACESTAQPPPRTLATAAARFPFVSSLGGIGCPLLLGGASTQRRRVPQFKKLPRYTPTSRTPGRWARALGVEPVKGVVANAL